MRFSRSLYVVDAHAEGESGKVVVGGLPPIHGESGFVVGRPWEPEG
ncbi:hypothetical protein ACWDWU_01195 [Streptomyces sp. NPDC003442]